LITRNAPRATAILQRVHPHHGASVGIVEPDVEGLIRVGGEKFDLEEEDGWLLREVVCVEEGADEGLGAGGETGWICVVVMSMTEIE
jgi:hypothetical protein